MSASTYVATPSGIRVSISWVSHAGRTPCRGVGTATSEAVCGPVNPRIVMRVESPWRRKPEMSAAETLCPAREPASCIARCAETVVRSDDRGVRRDRGRDVGELAVDEAERDPPVDAGVERTERLLERDRPPGPDRRVPDRPPGRARRSSRVGTGCGCPGSRPAPRRARPRRGRWRGSRRRPGTGSEGCRSGSRRPSPPSPRRAAVAVLSGRPMPIRRSRSSWRADALPLEAGADHVAHALCAGSHPDSNGRSKRHGEQRHEPADSQTTNGRHGSPFPARARQRCRRGGVTRESVF